MRGTVLRLALAASVLSAPANAEPAAAVPTSLMGKAAVVCAKVADSGRVIDVFLVRSTGSKQADADLIDYIRNQRWPRAKAGESGRNSWQPVPVAFGNVAEPVPPARCAPPAR